ncbi:MAG: hypothetical protein PF508_12725 [Spirochaeta sp.]|jgi:hypothetical protein|nr:hypothetical protein [Spirochaeta sp.]
MKRTVMMGIVLATIAIVGVSAWGPGTGGGLMWNDETLEETDLAGRLQLAENEIPVLVVGADRYQLMIHPTLAAEVDVENNERIEVSGFATEFSDRDLLGTTRVIHVRAIEADGQRVILPDGAAGGWGQGPGMMRGGNAGRGGYGQGMMGGYGAYDDDGDTGWWGPRGQDRGSFGTRRR